MSGLQTFKSITSDITQILLIHDEISDPETFVTSCNSSTFPIVYKSNSSKADLLVILNQFTSISRLAIACHNSEQQLFLDDETIFSDTNTAFFIDIIKTFGIINLDFLACNTLQYDTWNMLYTKLREFVIVGASDDNTGNIICQADWIMETINQDIKPIYFTDEIFEYQFSLIAFDFSTIANTLDSYSITLSNNRTQYAEGLNLLPPAGVPIISDAVIDNQRITLKIPFNIYYRSSVTDATLTTTVINNVVLDMKGRLFLYNDNTSTNYAIDLCYSSVKFDREISAFLLKKRGEVRYYRNDITNETIFTFRFAISNIASKEAIQIVFTATGFRIECIDTSLKTGTIGLNYINNSGSPYKTSGALFNATTFSNNIMNFTTISESYYIQTTGLNGRTLSYVFNTACFNKGTKILCLNTQLQDEYVEVEHLKTGDFVKTFKHGFRRITKIKIYHITNNPLTFDKCLYRMKKTEDMTDDLILTGWHSILVDDIGEYENEHNKHFYPNETKSIDGKYLLLCSVSREFTKLDNTNQYTVYHFSLDGDGDDDARYGVYANGVLCEIPSTKMMDL
jgi:hypothetical protein